MKIAILAVLTIVLQLHAAPYLVYPVNSTPFEADSVYVTSDSLKAYTSSGTRLFHWSDLLEVLQPNGESLARTQLGYISDKKAVVTVPGVAPVRMVPQKTRPSMWLIYPGAILVGFGVSQVVASGSHFTEANRLENAGYDPSHQRDLGEQQRNIGYAATFAGAVAIVFALTPRTTYTPVFSATSTGVSIGFKL